MPNHTHAFLESGELTSADVAQESDAFTCIACGSGMQLVHAEGNERHFQHESQLDTECSYQSYLHKLAKIELSERIVRDTNAGTPIVIHYEIDQICKIHADGCTKTILREFDLGRTQAIEFLPAPDHAQFADEMILDFGKKSLMVEIDAGRNLAPEKEPSPVILFHLLDLEGPSDIEVIRNGDLNLLKPKAYHFPVVENTSHLECDCKFKAAIEEEQKASTKFRSLQNVKDGYGYTKPPTPQDGRQTEIKTGSLCCTCRFDILEGGKTCDADEQVRPLVLTCQSYTYSQEKNQALTQMMNSK